MASYRKAKPAVRFDAETFAACVRLLQKGLESLKEGHFGKQPQHAPEIMHYSKAVGIMLGHFKREKVLKVRNAILGSGRIYNIRKQEDLAALRCRVAEKLLDEL